MRSLLNLVRRAIAHSRYSIIGTPLLILFPLKNTMLDTHFTPTECLNHTLHASKAHHQAHVHPWAESCTRLPGNSLLCSMSRVPIMNRCRNAVTCCQHRLSMRIFQRQNTQQAVRGKIKKHIHQLSSQLYTWLQGALSGPTLGAPALPGVSFKDVRAKGTWRFPGTLAPSSRTSCTASQLGFFVEKEGKSITQALHS